MKLKATKFATEAHKGQYRKNSKIPYVNHVLAVGDILENAGYPESVVVAGILHDTLEDTDTTFDTLVSEFGIEVAWVVSGVSEDKSLGSWKERKEYYLAHLTSENTPYASLIVSAADKLHNLTDTYEGWLIDGDRVFERFNAGKSEQSWWYRELVAVFDKYDMKDVSVPMVEMLDEMGL